MLIEASVVCFESVLSYDGHATSQPRLAHGVILGQTPRAVLPVVVLGLGLLQVYRPPDPQPLGTYKGGLQAALHTPLCC